MSRHRDVRNMDYSDDYHGYDDIYGHSMDDDYYISPSNRQFIYNRENSRDQTKIGEFIQTEQDIKEEDESDLTAELPYEDKVRLESCVEQIKATLGSTNVPKCELVNAVLSHNFNVEQAVNAILNDMKFPAQTTDKKGVGKFLVPKLSNLKISENKPKFIIPKLNFDKKTEKTNITNLVSSHLNKFDVNEKFSHLKLSDEPNKYNIDLSIALKTTSSNQSLNKSKTDLRNEKFDLPFIDCDVNIPKNKLLPCKFDSSNVLKLHLKLMKNPSQFSRILCRNYKRIHPTLIKSEKKVFCSRIVKFNFLTPSPDDIISKHLRKI